MPKVRYSDQTKRLGKVRDDLLEVLQMEVTQTPPNHAFIARLNSISSDLHSLYDLMTTRDEDRQGEEG